MDNMVFKKEVVFIEYPSHAHELQNNWIHIAYDKREILRIIYIQLSATHEVTNQFDINSERCNTQTWPPKQK